MSRVLVDPNPEAGRHRAWRWRESSFGQSAVILGAGYLVGVSDCDGEASCWTIKHRGRVLERSGWIYSDDASDAYHFDLAIAAAEVAFARHLSARKAGIEVVEVEG